MTAKKKNVKRENSYARQIRALQEVSRAVVSDLYLDDILRLIVTVTAEVMDSKICSLWFFDEREQALKLRTTQTIDKEYLKERSLKMGEGVVGLVAKELKPVMIYDVLKDSRYKEKQLAKKLKLSSMLSVPMQVKGRVVGVINTYTSSPHKFAQAEVETLITVANQAAIVIENTQLVVKTRVIREELEARKIIEKAKGILMREGGLGEEDAYRRIQKKSMDARKSMRDIAEAIIISSDLKFK